MRYGWITCINLSQLNAGILINFYYGLGSFGIFVDLADLLPCY
jgi:hypothetical protein